MLRISVIAWLPYLFWVVVFVVQAAVAVDADDSEDTLSARVLEQEHRLYPQAVRWFAEGRLRIDGARVRVLPPPDADTVAAANDRALVAPALDR